ncbi:MAG: TIGR00730 family Rossman fold protein [Gammaproteobacteria bacterium]
MKSICVYAGSASGNKAEFTEKAMELGYAIADKGCSMVYGGGSNGLMGVTADAALSKGAKVTGIITEQLDAIEVGHKGLTNLEIVSSMHKRKARMAELSDAIISLPGGVGTWEELFEALAWNQLGFYSKPIILFNVDGYYSSLYQFSKDSVEEGFLPKSTFEELFISEDLEEIFNLISSFEKKDGKDWYKRLER